MDPNYFAAGGVGSSIIILLGLLYRTFNHRRIRSTCCGHTSISSIDIETTTPPPSAEIPKN